MAHEKKLYLLKKQSKRIEERLRANLAYEEYLNKVRENSEEFEEINDIIERYTTLQEEHVNLQASSDSMDQEVEQIKVEMDAYERK